MQDRIDTELSALHTSAVDAIGGYDEALQKATPGHDLAGLFARLRDLHDQHADELAAVLESRGRTADDEGSFLQTIHRAVIDVRSWFHGLDESVLPGLIDGEQRNIARYDAAIDAVAPDDDPRTVSLLAAHRDSLAAEVQAMQVMQRSA